MDQKSSEKKQTVSISISAHHDEKTIESTIDYALKQECSSFNLEAIIIFLDNPNEATEHIVRKYASKEKVITVLESKEGVGIARGFELSVASVESEIIIRLDADVIVLSENLFNDMVFKIKQGNDLVGCRYKHSYTPKSFLRTLDAYSFDAWSEAKDIAGEKAETYKIIGCCVAFSKRLYKELRFCNQASKEYDAYFTLRTKELGYAIGFADGYCTTQESIDSIGSLVRRYARYRSYQCKSCFSKEFFKKHRPNLLKEFIYTYFKYLIKKPLHMFFYGILLMYTTFYMKVKKSSSTW